MVVPFIEVLSPHSIPAADIIRARTSDAGGHVAPDDATDLGHAPVASTSDALRAIESALAAAPMLQDVMAVEADNPEDRAHDAYFHVRRISADPAGAFLRSIRLARKALLQDAFESPTPSSGSMLHLMDRGLVDLFSVLAGGRVGEGVGVADWRCGGSIIHALRRWVRAHQVFAVLSQGLVVSLGAMRQAIKRGDHADTALWADLAASLLRGSGASFVLAGDFAVEDYVEIIRPSMTPPAAPVCLSGLMSADHRLLVQSLRDLKPSFRSLHKSDPQRHDALLAELSTVYDRHIHVCEKFVGDRPSLLTQGQTEKSGPALIEQFKLLRLKPLQSTAHAQRLNPAAEARSVQQPAPEKTESRHNH